MNLPPCKHDGIECPRRYIGCRAECEEYHKWLAIHDEEKEKHYVTDKTAPIWTRNIESAKCSHALARYRKICAELGGGVRIVSETEARRIMMMREYREAQNG